MSGLLRVLDWNIWDHLGDPSALARVIRSATADVVCLQEASRWPGSRGRLGRLADECGLVYVCGGRASAGTALLASVRAEVSGARAHRLPTSGFLTRPRGAATALVGLPGYAPVSVTSFHLGLTPAERAQHTKLLIQGLAGPSVLAGDLNETPDGPSFKSLVAALGDPRRDAPPTHRSTGPTRRIDAILTSLPTPEYATWTPDPYDTRRASDHLPTLAVVQLGGKA